MKQLIVSAALLLSALQVGAAEKKVFRISTDQTDLILQVGDNGRLYQTYLGKKLLNEGDIQNLVSASADGKYTAAPETKTILNLLLPLHTMTETIPLIYIMFLPVRLPWMEEHKPPSICVMTNTR